MLSDGLSDSGSCTVRVHLWTSASVMSILTRTQPSRTIPPCSHGHHSHLTIHISHHRGMFAPLGTCAGQSVRLQQTSIKDSCSECKGGSFNHVHGKCWLLGYRSVLRNDLGESWRWCSICNIKAGCMPICRESQHFFLKYGNLRQEQTVNVMEALGATSFSLKAFEMHRCLYYSQVPWGIWRFMWRIQPVWESSREWWKVFSVYCAGTMVKLSVINTNIYFSEACSQLLLLKRRLSSLSSAVLTDRQ